MKFTQKGKVFVPFGKPFFSLVTMSKGAVRLITLYLPEDDGICRGVVSTLHNPQAATFQPAVCPIVLKRIPMEELEQGTAASGYLSGDHPDYEQLKQLLDDVVSSGYAVVVTTADLSERRRPLALAS